MTTDSQPPARSPLRPSDLTIECSVRAPLLLEPVDSKIETLRTCEAEGDVDALLLRSWPDEVSLAEDGPNHEVVEQFERFEVWAESVGVSVRPPFSVRTSTSLVSEEPRRTLVTPILCLALYHEDRLLGVYPHSDPDGDATYTATEAIAALRTGEVPTPLGASSFSPSLEPDSDESGIDTGRVRRSIGTVAASSPSSPSRLPPSRSRCPSCEGELLNVQGIRACAECRWSDAHLADLSSARAKLVYLTLCSDPCSIETLQRVLGIRKIDLYGVLRTLSERDLVERTADGTYRARSSAWTDEGRSRSPRPTQ